MQFLIATALAIASIGVAVPENGNAPFHQAHAYDLTKLKGICGFVYSKARAPAGSGHRYVYQRMMEDAAGALPADDAATRKRKVQMLWRDNQTIFRCDASNFNITNGNILKYSVRSRSYAFLTTALENWELEINFVDPADFRTVLDYVRREKEANEGNSDSPTINAYFDALRERGAKYCFELMQPKFCTHPDDSSFLKNGQIFRYDGPERAAAEQATAEQNRRLREQR